MIINIEIIIKFSFRFLLTLNNTARPTPELTNKPAIKVPSVITFDTYSSLITIEEAQLGINPIKIIDSNDVN